MGSKKAPEYPTVKTNTGLFGTTITKGSGSTFKPTDFQKNLVGVTENNAIGALDRYLNPITSDRNIYEDEDFLRGDEYFNNQLNKQLQNNYLAPALSNNLLRGSTASDIMRGFGQDVYDRLYERQEDYRNQQLQNYMAAMLPYTTVYDMMKGTTGLSNALADSVGNYNLRKAQIDNQSSGLGAALGALGSIGGAALGNGGAISGLLTKK